MAKLYLVPPLHLHLCTDQAPQCRPPGSLATVEIIDPRRQRLALSARERQHRRLWRRFSQRLSEHLNERERGK